MACRCHSTCISPRRTERSRSSCRFTAGPGRADRPSVRSGSRGTSPSEATSSSPSTTATRRSGSGPNRSSTCARRSTGSRRKRGQFGGDPSRIVLVGRSAGAQLAMRLAYQEGPSSIRGVVNYYGPVDLADGWRHPPRPDPAERARHSRDVHRRHAGSEARALPPRIADHLGLESIRADIEHLRLARPHRRGALRPHARRGAENRRRTSVLLELPWSEHAFDAVPNGMGGQIALHYTERFIAWAVNGKYVYRKSCRQKIFDVRSSVQVDPSAEISARAASRIARGSPVSPPPCAIAPFPPPRPPNRSIKVLQDDAGVERQILRARHDDERRGLGRDQHGDRRRFRGDRRCEFLQAVRIPSRDRRGDDVDGADFLARRARLAAS